VFSAAWFAQHQMVLIGLLRLPVVGRLFRRVLAIRRHDVGYAGRIVAITPQSYTVANPDGSLTTDFRTHAKYGKRLYCKLLPMWKLLHAWDMHVANPLVPALNLGFDTLIVYTEPGNPATTNGDWSVLRTSAGESWSSMRGGTGTSTDNSATDHWVDTEWNVSNLYTQHRCGVWTFNTASLGAFADITAVTFSVWPSTPYGAASVPTLPLHVIAASPASYTQGTASDYQTRGTVSFGSITAGAYDTLWNGGTVTGYAEVTLNASGRANVAKSGISAFGTTHDWDLTGTDPASVFGSGPAGLNVQAETADSPGSANDPKLVVTYTVSSPMRKPNILRPRVFAPGRAS
jgi:hypothetical protein